MKRHLAAVKAGAARMTFGDLANERERFTDLDNLRDASHRAAALSRTLRAVADGELEASAELRFSLIQASRDLAEQVRRVTV